MTASRISSSRMAFFLMLSVIVQESSGHAALDRVAHALGFPTGTKTTTSTSSNTATPPTTPSQHKTIDHVAQALNVGGNPPTTTSVDPVHDHSARTDASFHISKVPFEFLKDPEEWLADHSYATAIDVDYGGRHPYELLQKVPPQRHLQQDDDNTTVYEPLRITVVTDFANELVPEQGLLDELVTAVDRVVDVYEDGLRVVPATSITAVSPGCPVGINGTFEETDLVVFVFADLENFCNRSQPALALGGNCQTDQFGRPTVGFIVICTSVLEGNPNTQSQQGATELIKHEMTHVLGFTSANLPFYRNRATGLRWSASSTPLTPTAVECVDGVTRNVIPPGPEVVQRGETSRGVPYFDVVTPTVVNVVRNQFNCSTLAGARLENQPTGTGECFGSHWDQRLFASEIMAPILTASPQSLSPLTLALLEDSGWYLANYDIASVSPYGHASGCDFVFGDCIINDGEVPSYGENIFCADSSVFKCDASHSAIASCSITTFDEALPPEFQYFEDPRVGGASRTLDYCPVLETTTFVTANSEPFIIDCRDPNSPGSFLGLPGERVGLNSRCIETTSAQGPLCLPHVCDEEEHAVVLSVDAITSVTCDFDGQQIEIPGTGVSIICPRLAEICPDLICPANCSGRGRCDYSLENPECVCFDPTDSSPRCENSPITPLVDEDDDDETIITIPPAPTSAPSPSQTSEPTFAPTLATMPTATTSNPTPSSSMLDLDLFISFSLGQFSLSVSIATEPPTASPAPSQNPSVLPSVMPSRDPTTSPSQAPIIGTRSPQLDPTSSPSVTPTSEPTAAPSVAPTAGPTGGPTVRPTAGPTVGPTFGPTASPSSRPSLRPTVTPTTAAPRISPVPTQAPVVATVSPTALPTLMPSVAPTFLPTAAPTLLPTTVAPTNAPITCPICSDGTPIESSRLDDTVVNYRDGTNLTCSQLQPAARTSVEEDCRAFQLAATSRCGCPIPDFPEQVCSLCVDRTVLLSNEFLNVDVTGEEDFDIVITCFNLFLTASKFEVESSECDTLQSIGTDLCGCPSP